MSEPTPDTSAGPFATLEAQLSEGMMVSLFVTRTRDELSIVIHSSALGDHSVNASGAQFDNQLAGAFLALRQRKRSSALLEQIKEAPPLPAPTAPIEAVKAPTKTARNTLFSGSLAPAAGDTTITPLPPAPVQDHTFDDLM